MTPRKILIIGGGVAGLAAARRLEELGHSALVLEGGQSIGGRVRTDQIDGYRLDRGFQVLFSSYLETSRLIEPLECSAFLSGALIWDGQRMRSAIHPLHHPYLAARGMLRLPFSIGDLARLAKVYRRQYRLKGETTQLGLIESGFSPQSLRQFFQPLFGGMFLDPELETHSDFFTFACRHLWSGQALLPAYGMGQIPFAIARGLNSTEMKIGVPVVELKGTSAVLADGTREDGDAVIIATDGTTAEKLLGQTAALRWRSTTTIYLSAADSPVDLPILVLNGSCRGVVRSLCVPSLLSEHYAPPGRHLISVTLNGYHEGDLHLVGREVKSELTGWFGNQVDAWKFIHGYSIEEALPIINSASVTKETPGVSVAGDWIGVPSIETAVRSGALAAERAIAVVQGGHQQVQAQIER